MNVAYVCNEMTMSVTAFARDPKSGALTEMQTVSTLPAGTDIKGLSTAEIFAHPSGKTLYVSNRTHDTIAVFDIAADGKLTLIQNAPTVKIPRGFDLSPDGKWLVVGSQSDNVIQVLKIEKDGKLTATPKSRRRLAGVRVVCEIATRPFMAGWPNATMKTLLALLALVSTASAAPVALFDGKTFDGWEGDTQKTWRIEPGEIAAGAPDKKQEHNDFLATTKEFGNFELRLKIKLVGTEGFVNSGVQFRSQRIPNHFEMKGYQADFGEGYFGALYDESRRNKVLAAPDKEVLEKAVKRNDWNDYRIRAEGPRIQLWLNGVQTVDYTEAEKDIPQTGLVALQIHGNAKAEVRFKDITIEELPA